jgi:hypothetical protein
MWRCVDLVWTDASEERIASIFKVENGGNISSETSVDTRSTQRHIPEVGILHSHRRENLRFYWFYLVILGKMLSVTFLQNPKKKRKNIWVLRVLRRSLFWLWHSRSLAVLHSIQIVTKRWYPSIWLHSIRTRRQETEHEIVLNKKPFAIRTKCSSRLQLSLADKCEISCNLWHLHRTCVRLHSVASKAG